MLSETAQIYLHYKKSIYYYLLRQRTIKDVTPFGLCLKKLRKGGYKIVEIAKVTVALDKLLTLASASLFSRLHEAILFVESQKAAPKI